MIKKIVICLSIVISLQAKDIILWDLHKVILNRSIPNTLSALLNTHTIQSITDLDWEQFKKLLTLSIDNLVHTKSSEDYIQVARQYDNQALIDLFVSLANAQTIMPGMPELIQELDQLGIEQQIGSNIGKTSFQILITQPDFAPIFDYMNIQKSQVVESDPEHIIKKPDPLFFKQYLSKNHYNPEKTRIIFIDDKKENVDTANALGLIGIHFKDSNQLRDELRKLNICVKPAAQKQTRFEGYKHLFK